MLGLAVLGIEVDEGVAHVPVNDSGCQAVARSGAAGTMQGLPASPFLPVHATCRGAEVNDTSRLT